VTPVQLKKLVGDETAKVGQGRAFKNGWIGKEGDGLVKLVSSDSLYFCRARLTRTQASTIKDVTQLDLVEIQSTGTLKAGEKDLADLRKRKLIVQRCLRSRNPLPREF
jgi:phenylalanyl-tRNA synthetase alpha chain